MRVCIGIDLDDYPEYASLVAPEAEAASHSFYDDALPRFLDRLDESGLRATFFAIGRDAERGDRRGRLREIAARGHEVGSHSHTHPYDFSRLSRRRKTEEIERAELAIADALGERPVGFRTPSCDVDAQTLEILAERGYHYDSSVFPSPLLWAFMLYGKLFVRRREYRLGHPLAALGPTRPYHPDPTRFYRPRRAPDGAAALLEIPFSVIPGLRIPFYSTLLRRLGPRPFSWMLRAYGRERGELNALFHLIDLAPLDGTALGRALARAPALSLPLVARDRFVAHSLRELAKAGPSATLRELAALHRADAASPPRA
jgi:peptidoglycan/xylan/chitin deacetylase (PgdA/CDA1 family)